MPVTAKLSKKFYDTLGDEVTNELVAWMNAVDESHRSDAAERLDARLSAMKARIDARFDRFEARMLRWMLVFWAGTMGTVIALLKL